MIKQENEKIIPKTLPGFMENLPKEQIKMNFMMDTIRKNYEGFGFLPLDTPALEYSEVLLAKTAGEETGSQIYRFTKGETDLSMRFDLTVPLAKFVAMHENEISYPFRRYQIAKVYRGEKSQRGRYREFYQADIDVIEDEELNLIHDAEIPSVIYKTFKELNVGDFTICINNRKILNGLFADLGLQKEAKDILRFVDKIEKIGEGAIKEEFTSWNIKDEKIEKIIKFINIKGTTDDIILKLKKMEIKNEDYRTGVKELEDTVKYMRIFGIPETNFQIDLTIARGLDYYTGTVYETFLNDYKSLGSVCSGGRYDNLSEFYTDKKLPGVGISIGVTRLFFQLNDLNLLEDVVPYIAKVLVIPMSEDFTEAINFADNLRDKGINTETYLSTRKIKAMFKYADKLNIPYVVVIGDEEILEKTVTIKNMAKGTQIKLSNTEAIEYLSKDSNK